MQAKPEKIRPPKAAARKQASGAAKPKLIAKYQWDTPVQKSAAARVAKKPQAGEVNFLPGGRIQITGPLAEELRNSCRGKGGSLGVQTLGGKDYEVYTAVIRVHNPDVLVDPKC